MCKNLYLNFLIPTDVFIWAYVIMTWLKNQRKDNWSFSRFSQKICNWFCLLDNYCEIVIVCVTLLYIHNKWLLRLMSENKVETFNLSQELVIACSQESARDYSLNNLQTQRIWK